MADGSAFDLSPKPNSENVSGNWVPVHKSATRQILIDELWKECMKWKKVAETAYADHATLVIDL